jgi:hypothetical protein
MEIWIQDISNKECHQRFGKNIPKKETKIDMIKFFGRDVLNELKRDPFIKIIVHNAQDLQKEKLEATKKEENVTMVIQAEEARKEEVTKTVARGRKRNG